jgi:hypothetical protein
MGSGASCQIDSKIREVVANYMWATFGDDLPFLESLVETVLDNDSEELSRTEQRLKPEELIK